MLLVMADIASPQPQAAIQGSVFPMPTKPKGFTAQKDQALQKEAKGADMDHGLGAAWDGAR